MLDRLYLGNIFGSRSIDVRFSPDLTLIHGINGSGKSTVLNIIGAIASGHLEALRRYEFKEIRLEYSKRKKTRFVQITWESRKLRVDMSGRVRLIDIDALAERRRDMVRSGLSVVPENFSQDTKALASEFELLYLPLSRDSRSFDNAYIAEQTFDRGYRYAHALYDGPGLKPIRTLDDSLAYVGELVKESQRQTMLKLNELNDKLRTDMFEASLEFYDKAPSEALREAKRLNNVSVSELRKAFSELGLLTDRFDRRMVTFLSKLQEYSQEVTGKAMESHAAFTFVINAAQIYRMQMWQDLVERTNTQKRLIKKPMETFLDTVNDFLSDSGKSLDFDSKSGVLTFTNDYEEGKKKRPLDLLSSGEKQLVIFFAYLIFQTKKSHDATFLIDEPELSLHLQWQERFTAAVMKAAPGVQLVFATHSPEIIGPFGEKCVNLMGRRSS